ncbi:hypothetical protein RA24_00005, partial [Leisingera sp. ANG-M6]
MPGWPRCPSCPRHAPRAQAWRPGRRPGPLQAPGGRGPRRRRPGNAPPARPVCRHRCSACGRLLWPPPPSPRSA